MNISSLTIATFSALWILLLIIFPSDLERITLINLENILEKPSQDYALGTDDLGRDIFARLISGVKLSLFVAFVVVSFTSVFGTMFGIFAAWCGGGIDLLFVKIIDMFLAFPGILLAIALTGILGGGVQNIMIALCAVGWVGFARLARAQTLRVKSLDHLMAAKALGTSMPKVISKHVLPLLAGPLIVEVTFSFAAVILSEAGLSFLGLGIVEPMPSLGGMIRDGALYLLIAPHYIIVTGLALMSLVFTLNLLGDGLRDHLDSKSV